MTGALLCRVATAPQVRQVLGLDATHFAQRSYEAAQAKKSGQIRDGRMTGSDLWRVIVLSN